MKEIECGESGKILLVKQKGEFYAVGNKCTHSGASLSKGVSNKTSFFIFSKHSKFNLGFRRRQNSLSLAWSLF